MINFKMMTMTYKTMKIIPLTMMKMKICGNNFMMTIMLQDQIAQIRLLSLKK